MKKLITKVATKDEGKNGYAYLVTKTTVQVTEIGSSEDHFAAREELNKIKCDNGHCRHSFFISDADSTSFTAYIHGKPIEELEKIGYTF